MQAAPTAHGRSTGALALRADHGDTLTAASDAARRFANSLRAHDGRERIPALIAGHAFDCTRCPVAATANMGLRKIASRWEVGAVAVKISPKGNVMAGPIPTPPMVIEFMAAFDAGAYPELDAARVVA